MVVWDGWNWNVVENGLGDDDDDADSNDLKR